MRSTRDVPGIGASLVSIILLCAGWLIISAGCGQGPAVVRPSEPLPKTAEVEYTAPSLAPAK